MRITATQIQQWADKPEAQGLLPVLVRRLIGATSSPTELAIRGADSTNLPGWDGTLSTDQGGTWVPPGDSRWEMGCSVDATAKARGDFKKRTAETNAEDASNLTYVFVSPRRWAGKDDWLTKASAEKHWRAVRAYDADDLEAWLEAAPSVALWFGELLGLRGTGIESIGACWNTWRSQTKIPLTGEAIRAGRGSQVERLREALSNAPSLIVVEADSTEEAVAFVCAELIASGQVDNAACVASPDGWRYVDANPQLRVLVAASPEIAAKYPTRSGTTLVVPVNIGDRPDYFSPSAVQVAGASHLVLERPDAQSFEKALIDLGEEETDAVRLARSAGRSWSVYRRIKALNPAVARPAWVKDPASRCLTTIALVGGWDEAKAGDVACLEAITGKKYEDLERELLQVARMDDSPVLRIGTVWKAKAPLELLYLFAPEFTREELTRYFDAAQAILAKPDPTLELEPDKRWIASIYGKARAESGIVIDAIVDSMAKLSVYAENKGDDKITSRIDQLIGTLLDDADGERWLSLSGVLRELAEASPDAFLKAAERSLRREDAPILRLLSESNHNSFYGRSWHVHLLWALEIVAWSPKYLGRAADILAQLTLSPLPDNVGNRPMSSLKSLLRPWWPQTTAGPEQRIAVIDRLIKHRQDVAWPLLMGLLPKRSMSASANAKPHWRDDDAGAVGPNDPEGFGWYLTEIESRILTQAEGRPERIAELVGSIDNFEEKYRDQIAHLVKTATAFPDEGREVVRSALRNYLSWQNSYNEQGGDARAMADRLRPQFDALQPDDLVTRHAWLFKNGWVEMPDGRDADFKKADEKRNAVRGEALKEIFIAGGWPAIERLIDIAGAPRLVGWQLILSDFPEEEVGAWAVECFKRGDRRFHDPALLGLLHALPLERREALLNRAARELDATGIAAFASAAPCERETWRFLERQSSDAQGVYWRKVSPGVMIADADDAAYLIDHLVEVGRQRTAFGTIHAQIEQVDGRRLFDLLEAISTGAEPDHALPDVWRIGEAIKAIESSGAIPRRQLALLEFRYFEALRYDQKQGARNLYAEMLDDAALFVECICLVFRAHNRRGFDDEPGEASKTAAALGGDVLHVGRGVPGLLADGSFDRPKFEAWVAEVRGTSTRMDRAAAADLTIGAWFSNCPADPDGAWPCAPVRDLLERADAEDIRRGFHTGVMNNRGTHSRALFEGGNQERGLAGRFRELAKPLHGSHPQTATLLESIAKDYDAQGAWHDVDSALMREGAR